MQKDQPLQADWDHFLHAWQKERSWSEETRDELDCLKCHVKPSSLFLAK